MFIKSAEDIASVVVGGPGANNTRKRVLIGADQGWQGWVMRLFTLGTDGRSPRHSHPWPHLVFVHAGEGTIWVDGTEHPVEAGHVAVVPSNSEHQFSNRGRGDFSFICVVPEEGEA